MALAPLFLLTVFLPGQMMLRCRIDGLLRPACCCPPEGVAQDTGPVVKAQDCCDEVLTTSQRPVVAPARRFAGDATSVSAAVAVLCVGVALAAPDRSYRMSSWTGLAHAPPWDRPPIVLLKHAFLI